MVLLELMKSLTWSSALSSNFKALLIAVLIGTYSPKGPAQILIPDESPEESTPKSEIFGVKSNRTNIDLKSADWLSFQKQIQDLEISQKKNGLAYMISGGLVLIGSSIGYASVNKSPERAVYSLSQSLSIAAIGYGYYQYSIGGEERSFYQTVSGVTSLTLQQKNELIASYYKVRKSHSQTNKWIHFSTYAAISALNFIQASQEKDKDLKNSMFLLGGITALAAISVHF